MKLRRKNWRRANQTGLTEFSPYDPDTLHPVTSGKARPNRQPPVSLPPEIIQYAVWLYFKFNLSYRDIEDLLSERGIQVSYEAIRLWCNKLGPKYAARLRRKHQGYGDTFYLDEVFIKIRGEQH